MADVDDNSFNSLKPGQNRQWNYQPQLPLKLAPFFDTPTKPKAIVAWLQNTWLRASPPVNHLCFSLIAFLFFWPSSMNMKVVSWDWTLHILGINFAAILLLAGLLHLYLYAYPKQDMRLKFDVKPMEIHKKFTFGYQTWDNIFWSLVSGVPIWSAWMILYFYVAANGWLPIVESFSASPIWFIVFFIIIRFWQSFHFYWIHRFIHHTWLFKNVHYLHHRNINVGPWSGISMHPVEHVLYYSSILIHFVLPSHPIHVIFHMFALNLGAVISHSGFDKLIINDKEIWKAGSFFHQLHHRFFQCNFGSEEMPLDRWFGSFHDGTDEATQRIREKMKKSRLSKVKK